MGKVVMYLVCVEATEIKLESDGVPVRLELQCVRQGLILLT